MRKYYIDNLRILCILLLIPFHAAMFYNSLDRDFYLHYADSNVAGGFVWLTYLWWMSLLFVMAGMSARYALNKRTPRQFIKERLVKLGRPLVFGTMLVIPVQTYIADIFHNGYEGGYFAHYKEFYKLTDWNGYDGHYTPGQLWFMSYLLIICLVTLPIILYVKKLYAKKASNEALDLTLYKAQSNSTASNHRSLENRIANLPLWAIILLAVPVAGASLTLIIGSKSLGEFGFLYLLGYYVFSHDEIQDKLEKYWKPLLAAAVVLGVLYMLNTFGYIAPEAAKTFEEIAPEAGNKTSAIVFDIYQNIVYRFYTWIMLLAVLGTGKHFLNRRTKFTDYFVPAIFPIYIFHQSVLVIVGFFVGKWIDSFVLQFIVIVIVTFALTLLCYELFSRIKATRFMFAIKPRK